MLRSGKEGIVVSAVFFVLMSTALLSAQTGMGLVIDQGKKGYNLPGKIYRIEDNYLHQRVVDSCRTKLVEKLKQTQEGITVGEFRDLVGGNRKICLLLLSRYDSEGLTKRIEDRRYLRAKGGKG